MADIIFNQVDLEHNMFKEAIIDQIKKLAESITDDEFKFFRLKIDLQEIPKYK